MRPIYTGTGDDGTCDLPLAGRVSKADGRVAVLGEIDELNSHLGLLTALLPDNCEALAMELQTIQRELFTVGSRLAIPFGELSNDLMAGEQENKASFMLEKRVDALQHELSPEQKFVLPGGHVAAAQSHVARAVCRRCERSLVMLMESRILSKTDAGFVESLTYINRLSDYLFLLANLLNMRTATPETHWP